MTTIRLSTLKLKNFQGIREFALSPHGSSIDVRGANATGKTTLFNAFMWLLTDQDSQGRKDFSLKTLDASGAAIPQLEHEVEAALLIDDTTLILRKVYTETWTRKRGSATEEFTGHSTQHYLDGVPVTKGEYDARVAAIADTETLRILTSPRYFSEQLHWQDRRNLLIEACGDVTDADVIASDPALASLPAILGTRSLDAHLKVVTAKRKEINDGLKTIPVRIDEARRGAPDVAGMDKGTVGAAVKRLEGELAEAQAVLLRIESGGEIANKTAELRTVEAELIALDNQRDTTLGDTVKAFRRDTAVVEQRIASVTSERIAAVRETEDIEKTLADLKAEQGHAAAAVFTYPDFEAPALPENCPACEQPIPAERREAVRAAAEADYNAKRAEASRKFESDKVQDTARRRGELTRLEKRLAELEAIVENASAMKAALEADVVRIDQAIAAAGTQPITEHENNLKTAKAALGSQITALEVDSAPAADAQRTRVADIQAALDDAGASLTALGQHEAAETRVTTLMAEEKALAAEYERLEGEVYLCERFTRAKVAMLDSKINAAFSMPGLSFRLFEQQINGAIAETCTLSVDGVPYGSLNSAARTNAGLAIIEVLGDHRSLRMPVFVDNSESIVDVKEIAGGQMVRLIVSAEHKTLVVENH